MFLFCTFSISVAPTVVIPAFRELVITGLFWDYIEVIQNNRVWLGIWLSRHPQLLIMKPLSPFCLEAAIVLFVIKIMFNFLRGAGAGKKFPIVPCICVIVWDCDTAFGTCSWMGFINIHSACDWSWGNIYRFPWIPCPSCNSFEHKQAWADILFHLSGWPFLNTSLCALFPPVIFLSLPTELFVQCENDNWTTSERQSTHFTCQSSLVTRSSTSDKSFLMLELLLKSEVTSPECLSLF